MKKSLLLVAAALVAVSASADNLLKPRSIEGLNIEQLRAEVASVKKAKADKAAKPAKAAAEYVTPEGDPVTYAEGGYFYSLFGLSYAEVANTVCTAADGKTLYVNSVFPTAMSDIWSPATVEEGTVTFNCETVVGQYYGVYDLVVGEFLFDEEGNISGLKDLVMKKDGDRFYIEDNIEAIEHYAVLGAYTDGEFQGYLSYAVLLDFQVANVGEPVSLPAGAEPKEVIYTYKNYNGVTVAEKNLAYTDGNDLYLNNLTQSYKAWVKGTIEGNKVTFAKNQYIGADTYFFYYNPFIITGVDEDGYSTIEFTDFVLTLNEDGSLTQDNADVNSAYTYTSAGDLYNYGYDYVITPYEGPQFDIPSDPSGLSISDYWDYFEQMYFGYSLVNIGVNGTFLDPENYYYTLYVDEEPYAVGPDNFTYISEEMVEIPLNYVDEYGGYDLGPGYAYIAENLFETIGVQGIYYFEGKPYYTNIVSVDLEGNVYVKEVENGDPTGITKMISAADAKKVVLNAMGQKSNSIERGFNIVNGKKLFVK